MGNDTMVEDYAEQDQRLAVCFGAWRDREKAARPPVFWKHKETGMRYVSAPLEIKQLDERGTFEGLAAVYGNVDLGGDVIEPGAFKEFVETRDGNVRILDGHNMRSPIGKGKLTDTHLGLAIKGRLNLAVARAREVYELMKDDIIDGLSIGYDILPAGSELLDSGVRKLKALKVWEVSTTPFPMNSSALVSSVKGIERVSDVRELEELLRDAAGLSARQAKLHAGAIWSTKTGQRDVGGEEDTVQRLTEMFLTV
jgi:HK97 family phage prohead protease